MPAAYIGTAGAQLMGGLGMMAPVERLRREPEAFAFLGVAAPSPLGLEAPAQLGAGPCPTGAGRDTVTDWYFQIVGAYD
jgi:hypothetical protein